MHKARTDGIVAYQIVAMGHKSVDKRSAQVSGGRMDDKSWRFVDDEQISIFVEDLKAHVLRRRTQWLRRRKADGEEVSCGNEGAFFAWLSIDMNEPLFNTALKRGS